MRVTAGPLFSEAALEGEANVRWKLIVAQAEAPLFWAPPGYYANFEFTCAQRPAVIIPNYVL